MKLLVDVGNTAIKAVLFDGKGYQACELSNLPWSQIKELVYACVGSAELLKPLLAQAQQHAVPYFEAEVTAKLAMLTCAYQQFQNLGIDRWLAVIAAYVEYPQQNCIIIDAGTATTIDVLNKEGAHLGGWILPGLDLMTSSLTQNTQRVFDDKQIPFTTDLGRNTPNGLKNGAMVATLGAIELAKQHLNQQDCQLLFAGGYGKLLADSFIDAKFDSLLVFKGLNYWHEIATK
ncbi:type III pantothenate kinase [Pseudoalteromonas sp. MEBiC 03485]|uniref:type III pantothenate kinase n=1 Tax=Pseudoalteromonas sp. MEBiC 03485 TaxID=2571103 RepID=UPI00101F6975|nr:type III pantothenate kinase [Pseudoalteromonas sp. MEBiC 03485]RZD21467.1 type III pantothenate kinase [Pseudoalteromonas sp. MEBiC 03485]